MAGVFLGGVVGPTSEKKWGKQKKGCSVSVCRSLLPWHRVEAISWLVAGGGGCLVGAVGCDRSDGSYGMGGGLERLGGAVTIRCLAMKLRLDASFFAQPALLLLRQRETSGNEL